MKTKKENREKNKYAHVSNYKLRGREFIGEVKKTAAQKTATVEWSRLFYIPKYERYEKRKTRLQVHNPPEINAQVGDKVRIVETRPISKTKNFIIVEKL